MSAEIRPLTEFPRAVNDDDSHKSRLEREGSLEIQETALYTLSYLEECYPPEMFRLILKKCPVILSRFVYGKSWIAALESVMSYQSENIIDLPRREPLFSIDDVARITNTGRDTIERCIQRGDLVASDFSANPGAGRALWRISGEELDAFILKRCSHCQNSTSARLRPVSSQNGYRG